MHVNAFVPGTEGTTHPGSGQPQAIPPLCPTGTASNQDGI